MSRRLQRAFFDRDPLAVAPDLVGKFFISNDRDGRIVEVEAYRGEHNPGSHGYRGVTPRTAVMFGPPGHLYVYFSYGMHWCANVVCGPSGVCGAVLIRALPPTGALAAIRRARPTARRDPDLCSGPAKLCAALSIAGEHKGLDLTGAELGVELRDDGYVPAGLETSPRIGMRADKGSDLLWRFFVPSDPDLSR